MKTDRIQIKSYILILLSIYIFVSCDMHEKKYNLISNNSAGIVRDAASMQTYYVGSDHQLYCVDPDAVTVWIEDFSGTLLFKKDNLLYFINGTAFCSLSLEDKTTSILYQLEELYSHIWFDGQYLRWIGENSLTSVDIDSGEKVVISIDEPIYSNSVLISESELYFNRYGDRNLVEISYKTGKKSIVAHEPAIPYGNIGQNIFCMLEDQAVQINPHTGKKTVLFDCGDLDMKCISAASGYVFYYTGRENGQHIDSRNYYMVENGTWKYLCNVPNIDSLVNPNYIQIDDTLYFRSLYLPEHDYLDLSATMNADDAENTIYQYALKSDGTLYLLSKETLDGPLT